MSAARECEFDDGGQGGTFLQEGVMPENRIDFDELPRAVQARDRALHVVERNQLVFAHAIRVAGDAPASHPSGAGRSIRSARERFGTIFLHVVVAAGEQVVLDRESKTIFVARGRAPKRS